ncbi:L-histidine N(alpha)-methyltransferase [Arcticibacter sp.]|uniref:L-histidine N(alpha)-methyltransferase n=1 Tax=Arcticibacter sp. TaxID=1872630 RepID=UPI00388DFB90
MNEISEPVILSEEALCAFRNDVMSGLKKYPKELQSKYLYDAEGDELFRQIMNAPEYYLTDCEMEIFKGQCDKMVAPLRDLKGGLDLIELGAGDAAKSYYLLDCLMSQGFDFTYYPIDISANIINLLTEQIPARLPGIRIKGIQGDYFDALQKTVAISSRPKLVMFLGGNIGNMHPEEAINFCTELRRNLSSGDMVLMGFDLKKDPWIIFNAYNDQGGITEKFNLNLLSRINRELGADFDIRLFHHYENYDPETGACKSYLISKTDQVVTIGEEPINFSQHEYIFTETSQKYTTAQIDAFASGSGFTPLLKLTDSKGWFADVIWRAE